MAERILMIDDDDRLAGMVSDYLGGAGFRVTVANTGRDGEAQLKDSISAAACAPPATCRS
jgi:DNA-binding response OmpR family regulator